MQFEHSFTLPVGVAEAWRMLLDGERVAAALPDAELSPSGDGTLVGTATLTIGPIGIPYQVKVALVEREDGARTAVVEADGREIGGTGTAVVTTIVILTAEGAGATRGDVVTDLTVTGRLAQFGQTMLSAAAARFVDVFVARLNGEIDDPSVYPDVLPRVSADAERADRLAAGARPTPIRAAALLEPAAAPARTAPPGGPDVGEAAAAAGVPTQGRPEPKRLPWPTVPKKSVPVPVQAAPTGERLRPAFALAALLLLVVTLLRRRRG